MDDPEHARYRRMLIGDFTVRRTETLRPAIERIVDELLDAMVAGPRPVDLVEAFALPLPSMVICQLLGVPYSDHDLFQRLSRTLLDIRVTAEEAERNNRELRDYLRELVAAKQADPGDDLVSRLVERIRSGELDRDEVVGMARLLLVAGHETTANMIGLGVIAAGESANRDPARFADPDRLDIHRGTNHHVAFGFGIHQCLGQPLARLELQIAYPALLHRFPDLRVAADLDDIAFRDEMVVYGVHGLPVTW